MKHGTDIKGKRRPGAWEGILGGAASGAWVALTAAALLYSGPASAQTCAEPKATDFKKTVLVSPTDASPLDHPVHLAVVPDGRVFIAEMTTGNIQVYKPGVAGVALAGNIVTRFENEDGLLGIAAPPDFATTHFLYAFYSDPSKTTRAHVLTRFTVVGDKLDMNSKVEIFRYARVNAGIYHAGGGMVFDDKGNLIISTGDDTNPHGAPNEGYGAIYWKDAGKDAQKSAANSNDLRGKVLRIHPETAKQANGLYYTIPAGNLFPVGKAKTRPEIYTMGLRNPYRVTVDNKTGWIIWGEVGPDADNDNATRGRAGHDELNVATKPGFFGWPYCNGNQFAYNDVDYSGDVGVNKEKFDCSHPVNKSPNNTGIDSLPPAQPPVIWYAGANKTDFQEMGQGGETAMAGPVYRYNKALVSTVKFPPQYDGRIFFWDWSRRVHKMVALDDAGKLKKIYDFPDAAMKSDISAQYGPEGALYVLQYSETGYGDTKSALLRIDYTGLRDDACAPVSLAQSAPALLTKRMAMLAGFSAVELPAGMKGFEAFDMQGKRVWSYRRAGDQGALRVEMPQGLAHGLVRIRFL